MKWFYGCIIGFLAIMLVIVLTSNKNPEDYAEYDYVTYNYAIITLPTGELVEGPLDGYLFGDERVSVRINGVWYSVAHLDVALMEKR